MRNKERGPVIPPESWKKYSFKSCKTILLNSKFAEEVETKDEVLEKRIWQVRRNL